MLRQNLPVVTPDLPIPTRRQNSSVKPELLNPKIRQPLIRGDGEPSPLPQTPSLVLLFLRIWYTTSIA